MGGKALTEFELLLELFASVCRREVHFQSQSHLYNRTELVHYIRPGSPT